MVKRSELAGSVVAAFFAAAVALGCSTSGSGVGGETHFVCKVDADCIGHVANGVCTEGECVPSDAAAAGGVACGGSALVGKYLWKVGNCEVGALSPFDAKTCESTVCGGNARTLDECTGTHLFTYRIDGSNVTIDGAPAMTLRRTLDCGSFASAERAECEARACFLTHFDNLYTAFGSQTALRPDDFWLATDQPWPGRDACNSSPAMRTIDPSVCSDGGLDGGP